MQDAGALSEVGGERGAAAPGGMSAQDLAELMASFNEVTAKLEQTHAALRAEVARLKGELRRANDELERSRRLAALGEMAAGISHEIRNPLGSLRLYARMLVDDLGDRPEQRDIAAKMGASVTRLDEVVNDVLSFARETRVRPAAACAADLLEGAGEACGGLAAGVEVSVSGGDVEVWCDYGLAHRAIVNVVRNAVEAVADTDGGGRGAGRVEVSAATEAVACEEGGEGCTEEWAVVRVRDDGPGVPPGVIERMFNPFFTTRAAGTGLGLAIVHRIMDAHGGRVSIRNNAEGEAGAAGATVELWFPPRPAAGTGPRGARGGAATREGTESLA